MDLISKKIVDFVDSKHSRKDSDTFGETLLLVGTQQRDIFRYVTLYCACISPQMFNASFELLIPIYLMFVHSTERKLKTVNFQKLVKMQVKLTKKFVKYSEAHELIKLRHVSVFLSKQKHVYNWAIERLDKISRRRGKNKVPSEHIQLLSMIVTVLIESLDNYA